MAEKKKPVPKRLITEQDIERIMRTAPDYINESTDEVKDLYVAAEWAKEERDLSPKRYFDLVLNEGTDEEKIINIDFQQTVNVGAVVKTHGGDITAVRSANAKRLQYLQLDRAYNRAVLELNKAMGVRSRKPRNIVDYTGTIMELFGKFYTVTDVSKVMAKEYKIKVPEDELKKFYVENRDLITRRHHFRDVCYGVKLPEQLHDGSCIIYNVTRLPGTNSHSLIQLQDSTIVGTV
jgi:hypothetical protein